MNKLNTFWYSFKRSLSDVTYYPDILKVRFGFSLLYLFVLMFFITLISSVMMAVGIGAWLPELPKRVDEAKKYVRTAYPSELEVQVKNGIVSTNVEEPYYINIPGGQIDKSGTYEHLITIDTAATAEDYTSLKTVVLLTKNGVVYPDNQQRSLGSYKVTPFQATSNFIINKDVYSELVKKVEPWMDKVPGFVTILLVLLVLVWPIVGGLLAWSWQLTYLLVAGLLLWFISKAFNLELTYGKVYQMAMHGITGPIVGTFLLGLFGVHINYLFTAGLVLWMAIVMSKMKTETKPVESAKA